MKLVICQRGQIFSLEIIISHRSSVEVDIQRNDFDIVLARKLWLQKLGSTIGQNANFSHISFRLFDGYDELIEWLAAFVDFNLMIGVIG